MRRCHIAVVIGLACAVAAALAPAMAAPSLTDAPNDRMTISDLRHAVVPAYCDMPRQRLHGGETAERFLPRQGWIDYRRDSRPIYAHLRDQGRNVVAAYICTAGGVGWPSVIVAYSNQGRLIDALRLSRFGHQEHADVTNWRARGHSVRMRWTSYEGAGYDRHRYHSRVTLEGGRLALHRIR
jgi:hypothetical protein